MRIIGLDPGTTQSAIVRIDENLTVLDHAKLDNKEILQYLKMQFDPDIMLFYEMIQSFGMPVGSEVFETILTLGQFIQVFTGKKYRIYRSQVKMNICKTMKANDASIRQALIDRYGGKEAAIGNKKNPGRLYGLKGDEWSALALALTGYDQIVSNITEA